MRISRKTRQESLWQRAHRYLKILERRRFQRMAKEIRMKNRMQRVYLTAISFVQAPRQLELENPLQIKMDMRRARRISSAQICKT